MIPPGKTVIPRHECITDISCPSRSLNETKTPIFCDAMYDIGYCMHFWVAC